MTRPNAPHVEKTPAQVAQMSPMERDQYFQGRAVDGVDSSSPWFAPFQQWLAESKAKKDAADAGDKQVKQLTADGDVEYVTGLKPSSTDYLGHDHQQLEQFVGTNLDPGQVSNVSQAYFDVHRALEGYGKTLNTAIGKSAGEWEGTAAQSAQGYFTSLGKWTDANSQNARLASETIYDQGTAASNAKNQMPAPIPFSWNDEFKSWATSNPFNLGDNIDESIQKQKDSQEAHTQAAGVMKSYDKELFDAASKQPVFAEPPKFTPGGGGKPVKIDENGPDGGGDPPGTKIPPGTQLPGDNGHTGSTGSTGNSDIGNSSYLPPNGNIGVSTLQPGSHTGSALVTPGHTTPTGFQGTNNLQPAASNVGNSQMGGMGAMPMGGMGAMGGMGGGAESDYNSKVGRGGGGFGPGGGSSGAGGGSSSPGGSSGAARPGGVGAAEAAAGRGMGGIGGGAAGRGGPGMGGGMAGRGKNGEGEEDTEHQRPTYLVEGDPDEVFGTDMRTAPPVIGE